MNCHVRKAINNRLALWEGRGVVTEDGQEKVQQYALKHIFEICHHHKQEKGHSSAENGGSHHENSHGNGRGAKHQTTNFNGLPVTIIGSKPDFDFWNKQNQVLVMGEGKNGQTYNSIDSLRQCMVYLIANLYHCVVFQHKPDEAVWLHHLWSEMQRRE